MSSKSAIFHPNPDKIEIKSALKLKKWYKNKVAVTGSNQWKFDNKIVKFQWNISLISKPENQWKVIIKSAIFEIKFRENQLNSCTTPYSILRENQWKVIINSLKINENQWKSSSKSHENQLFLPENWVQITHLHLNSPIEGFTYCYPCCWFTRLTLIK